MGIFDRLAQEISSRQARQLQRRAVFAHLIQAEQDQLFGGAEFAGDLGDGAVFGQQVRDVIVVYQQRGGEEVCLVFGLSGHVDKHDVL